jgi:hypothetical protein
VKYIPQCLIWAALLASPLGGQPPSVIPLSSEPHHHLVLHNRYVNVYHVEVRPQATQFYCTATTTMPLASCWTTPR